MAIPNDYIDKITNKDSGESRIISPAADKVRVDNENFEGTDLDEVLDEVAQAIGESGSGDGTVTGVKVGSTTYEPTDGVVDLSTPFGGKVDKNGTDSLMTAAEHTKLSGIAAGAQVNVINSISVNGTAQTPTNGNVNIQVSAGDQVSVIQPDPADGTFIIRVGSNDYTINLNHTHADMAKIVKCTEATLPQTLEDDTIYVQVDNATTPTEIECLYLFGLEFTGGGLPSGTPQINKPVNGSTVNLGTIYGQGGATGTIRIKGRSLTANSTVVVSVDSGFSLSYGQQSGSSVNIDAADVVLGCDVTVYATVYGTDGTMTIASQTDNISVEVDLTSDVIEDLAAVKFTGSQWLQTDYKPNPNTEFELDFKFTQNANSQTLDNKYTALLHCNNNVGDGKLFKIYHGYPSSVSVYAGGNLFIINDNSSSYKEIKGVKPASGTPTGYADDLFTDHSKLRYVKNTSNCSFSRNSTSGTISFKTSSMESAMSICYGSVSGVTGIYNIFDLTIYEFTITEGGNTVHHWVPKSKNGVAGLYDTVTNTFISSETSTELVAIPLT